MEQIIVITGPTASGKTSLSIELAQKYNAEIISADSRQIFEYLDIGTAKVTKEEQSLVKHHFIDEKKPDEYYSAGQFGDEAFERVNEIKSRNKNIIVVGGPGLYVKSLFEGLFEEEESEQRSLVRQKFYNILSSDGENALYDKLLEVDPESAAIYHDRNHRRIIRALEHYEITGRTLSSDWKKKNKERQELNPIYFAIDHNREELYSRINKRTELMWKEGLVEETKGILEMGFSEELNSLNTVGYKEAILNIKNELSLELAIEEMQKNTRRFAKRQLTWCRNQIPDLIWLDPNSDMIEKIDKRIKKSP